ncbi:uncharacterized protein [Temnothorax nylanderi]|uniref:uncharacterized protein n=1 Tax=Temnothorax nylanderi TaxID=102681 RepID=UPI003A874FA0
MDDYHRPATNHCLESNSSSCTALTASEAVFMYENSSNDILECKTESEEDENEQPQDNDSQTSTPSCVSKMDYTLPKYRNNVSPAIDKIVRMMNMPSLITSQDSSSGLSMNCISSPGYCCDGNENFAVPVMAKEHLDICFSSPKPFVSAYKRGSAEDREDPQSRTMKVIEPSLCQIGQESMSGWQEIADPDGEPIVDSSRYEDKIYVSEVHFLLMVSNRNRRATLPEGSRRDSKDSAFSEFMGSDEE